MRLFRKFAFLGAISVKSENQMGEESRIDFMNIYQQMKSGGSLSDIAKDHFGEDLVKCEGGEWSPWFDADDPSGLGKFSLLSSAQKNKLRGSGTTWTVYRQRRNV